MIIFQNYADLIQHMANKGGHSISITTFDDTNEISSRHYLWSVDDFRVSYEIPNHEETDTKFYRLDK